MATQSVPGTAVPVGAAISPAGGFGAQGNPGPAGGAGPAGPMGAEDVGSVKAWPTPTPPASWMIMDHSAVSRTLYPDLFALVGTTFGSGDGTTTFNLPDARGSFILSMGQSTANGNTLHSLADQGGEELHVNTVPEMASHTHVQTAHTHTTGVPSGAAGAAGSNYTMFYAGGGTPYNLTTTSVAAVNQNTGGGTGHNTMPPFLCLVYIIKVSKTGGSTTQAPIADTTQPGLMNAVSGNLTDYIGGDNASHPALSLAPPTNEYYDYDDFFAINSVTANTLYSSKLFQITASGTGNAITQVNANNFVGHPGVLQITPGTAAGGYTRGYACPIFNDGNIIATIQGIIAISTGSFAGINQYFFGYAQSTGPAMSASSYYAGWFADAGIGPNWMMYTRSTATVTSVDSGIPVGSTTAWFKLKVVLSQGQAVFYLNDNLMGTTSDASIPPGTQFLWNTFFTNNATGTANYSMFIDCVDIWLQLTAQSGQSPTRFMRRII